jgi:hypothetical protein
VSTHRYHTRVICVVHSHVQQEGNGVVDCSGDIVQLQTSKSIKGTGGASFTLVPRKNYFNYLFPNDLVNIYIDPGDGKSGFIRTFMGYVDRVERSEHTNDQGAMETRFVVTCSDFAKAIDKTELYFNPALANRSEMSQPGLKDFANGNIGGNALRTKGITAHGTPAQFIENLLQLLLGFGAQWQLPRSYPASTFLQENAFHRRQRAKSRLPEQVLNSFKALFNIQGDIDEFLQSFTATELDSILAAKQVDINTQFVKSAGFTSDYYAKQAQLSTVQSSQLELSAYQTILQETSDSSLRTILDLMSLDFIEALTVDGFISSQTIWANGGTLASTLYGWSNEIVNELCFDLRPVVADGDGDACFGTIYSKDDDDLGINTTGFGSMMAATQAVKYVPAVVFREYPYSVVEGLDLTNYHVDNDSNSQAGFQAFGPIFALDANIEGRVLYNYESVLGEGASLTPEKCYYDPNGRPLKHLDVVTIVNTDVATSQVGRSDADIFNLYMMSSSDVLGTNWNWILNDILPILTPVSIARSGLRLRQLQTKFANYARDQLCNVGSSAVDSAAIRYNLIRWTLLIDHWYQHNHEYLSGTIQMRGRPDIRVGYRLDWVDRHESYYIEAVGHQWQYGGPLTTTLQVSRGQRNDPFPAYIPPILSKIGGMPNGAPTQPLTENPTVLSESDQLLAARQQSSAVSLLGGGNRGESGRLAAYFNVRDTKATTRAVGGKTSFSQENIVDLSDNVPGPAEFPNTTPTRYTEDVAQTLANQAIPPTGSESEE